MINKGKKVLDGELKKIQSEHGKNSIHLEFDGDGKFIKSLPMVKSSDYYGNYIEVQLHDNYITNDLLNAVLDKIQVTHLKSQQSSLNEIFISLAGGGKE